MSGASDLVLLARVAGSLVTVVLLALVAARIARRSSRRTGGTGQLRVCERVGLSRESAAVVLEVDGRRLLLAVAPSQVTLLTELDGPHVPQASQLPQAPQIPQASQLPQAPQIPRARPAAAAPRVPQPAPGDPLASGQERRPDQELPPQRPGAEFWRASVPANGRSLPLSRRAIRELDRHRRLAVPPTQRGSGSVLDRRTWQQSLEALRDKTARRG